MIRDKGKMDKPQSEREVRRAGRKETAVSESPRTREELLILLEIERRKNKHLRRELQLLSAMDCT